MNIWLTKDKGSEKQALLCLQTQPAYRIIFYL